MARPTVNQILTTLTEGFQQPYTWDIEMISLPPALKAAYRNKDRFNLQCLTAQRPKLVGDTSEIYIRGNKVPIPGVYNPNGTIDIQFVETPDNYVKNLIKQWVALTKSKTVPFSQQTGTIRLVEQNLNDEGIWEYDLLWAWISDYSLDDFSDGSSSDPVKPTITVSFCDFKEGPVGSATFTGSSI